MSITYASIGSMTHKRDENGHLVVRGIASDDTLDLDKQSCDPEWLKSAIPEWSRIGNIREMHGSSAVGKALSIEQDGKGWVVEAKIVDKAAAEKIEEGIYTGFSIGIKNAVVDKSATASTKAPNGIIKGGEIVEISVVDRPANPSSVLSVVKSIETGELILAETSKGEDAQTSELPYANVPVNEGNIPCSVCNGLGKTSDLSNQKECAHCEGTGYEPADGAGLDSSSVPGHEYPEANYNPGNKSADGDLNKKDYTDKERADLADKGQALPDGSFPIKTVADLKNAIHSFGRAKDPAKVKSHIKARAKALGRTDLIPDTWEKAVDAEIIKWAESLNKAAEQGQWLHDPADLAAIRVSLIDLIKAELDEMASGEEDELCDISQLTFALEMFLCWWSGEASEGETTSPFPETVSPDMAYIGLGVNADLIKSASAVDATDEARAELRAEIVKSLGLQDVQTIEAKLTEKDEVIKSLEKRLSTVEQMAAPGGPSKTVVSKNSPQVSRVVSEKMTEADKLFRLSATITDPTLSRGYREDALRLMAEAESLTPNN